MDTCYLLVDVQEIRIQPNFSIKQGDYFFFTFSWTPCSSCFISVPARQKMIVCESGNFQFTSSNGNFMKSDDLEVKIKSLVVDLQFLSPRLN